ncbi:MAG TPA: pyridoxamine 5'-phosphate oxidase [Caulobacteraceae bacterium]|nr:pyridoxamine 5'-phosphate oxidase [Caulobacteraceae bacterium]
MTEVPVSATTPHAGADASEDPIALFEEWFAEAKKAEPDLAEAMALATADESGFPDCRMVLLKHVDAHGFCFYTHTKSAKGEQLAANPRAALTFHWKSLGRQVRARGRIEPVTAAEADAYFASRARPAQVGAWASAQSRPMSDGLELERRVAKEALRFGVGKIPRPPDWSGYRLVPEVIEFWKNKPFRLHERLQFVRSGERWTSRRLFP